MQFVQRAAANPIVLGEAGDPRKMYMIGDLADYYKRKGCHKEAQALIKHVIDSHLVPADLYRFYLAESYTHTKDYDKAAEILSYLYCKRVFKAETALLRIFEGHNKVCLREAVYDILNRVIKPYLEKGVEYKEKGDVFADAGDHAGEFSCNIYCDDLPHAILCHYLCAEAGEQYHLAVESCRTAADLSPDSRTLNDIWVAFQMHLWMSRLGVHSSRIDLPYPRRQRGKGEEMVFYSLMHPDIHSPSDQAQVEVFSYFSRSEMGETFRRFPHVRVTVLPKPENWPTRPKGGFKNNSEGFD